MLNLKKTAVAVLALGSSAVFAGTMGPVCAPGNVTVPCEATAWDFGAQALYLEQSFQRPDAIKDFGLSTDYTLSTNRHHDNRWGWGFQIEGSYHFNTGNDVDLNWYHMNRSNTFRFTAVQNLDSSADLFRIRERAQWDAVNLEVGQHVDFSQWTKIRFHEGAQYSRINASSSILNLTDGNFSRALTETYNGFGPRAGADMYYDVGNGFAVYGKAAMALLAGTNKFSTRGFTAADTTSTARSRTVVVPELEGKLGAKYTYAMASGDLTLDVGYMWVDYLNSRIRATGLTTADDFSLNGVYFGAKWVGNVA
jgi:opacity protein-like surface antigen